jgi:DNA-binding Xre family transcriptional regulator
MNKKECRSTVKPVRASELGWCAMITFDRLWVTMKKRNISQYKLIKDYGFSSGQLDRLRKNENVSTYTLDQLCSILDCRLEDIAEYRP